MTKRVEFQIEKLIDTCNGDLHGAIRALMLVNEHLESELELMHATLATDWRLVRRAGRSIQ
jgi:hypothetical protein